MLSPARRTSKQNKRGRGFTGQVPGENGHSQARLVRRRIVSADHRARGEQARVEGRALRTERTKIGVDPDAHPKGLMLALDFFGEEIPDVLIHGALAPGEERQVEHRFRKALGPGDATPDELPGREDGGGGLGHPAARLAMAVAVDKAKQSGVGIVPVRNSAHFGACGFYALMAVEAGLIGMVTTSASGIQVAPTFGAQARLGTDPIAFAAPGRPGEPFLLDMATTTVAAGKIRNKANENLPTPPGWLVTSEGKPSTDPREVSKGGFMTPLGGTPEGSSHKGYGLSAMVNILSSALSGASMITDPMHTKRPGTMGIGHFLLALDPGLFRDAADFRADVTTFCDTLRATKPADANRPVLVAGDPERRTAQQRRQSGIPVGPNLLAKVRDIALASGAKWIMDG